MIRKWFNKRYVTRKEHERLLAYTEYLVKRLNEFHGEFQRHNHGNIRVKLANEVKKDRVA
jgi:hypothetical protein